jgi:DNA (cytosine-5)-methyltransferase 1
MRDHHAKGLATRAGTLSAIVATALKTRADANDADRIVEILAARYGPAVPGSSRSARKSTKTSTLSPRAAAVASRLGHQAGVLETLATGAIDHLDKHARQICVPRPKCGVCPLVSFCPTGVRALSKMQDGRPVVVDLFGGAGGMGYGFRLANFRVGLAVEWDRDAAQSYRLNNPGVPVVEMNVGRVDASIVRRFVGKNPDVVCAGPPCQSYSLAGHRADDDPKHHLFRHVLALARVLRPKMIVIENVPGISRNIRDRSYKDIVTRAIGRQFDVEVLLLEATSYGVPQTRRRYFFIGRPKGSPEVGVPTPTHCPDHSNSRPPTPTVLDVLRTLPPRNHGSSNDVQVRADGTVVRNLSTMLHSGRVLRKIAKIRPGEGPFSYRRLRARFARTIVAGHRALPVHPTRNRTLSVREAALLQGFPEHYAFLGPRANQPLQVANAVPPPLAKAIARRIKPRLKIRGKHH